MKTSKLKIAELSDIHLGHPNTPTEHIVSNLMGAFPDTQATAELDIIFIAGDVFDRQLSFPDPQTFHIRLWIQYMLKLCEKHDIVLRILEGTPSHDWKQSEEFIRTAQSIQSKADVKYISDLDIEYIERFGINVLYIPDEYRVKCDDTWSEVLSLMNKKGLETVDFTIMHGTFPHQMPKNLHDRLEMHKPERYLEITEQTVLVGHIHQYSQYEHILAAGSFDRLCHGDEISKGHLRLVINRDGDNEYSFIENTNAMVYKTIDCTGFEIDSVYEMIKETVKDIPECSFIRLRGDSLDTAIVSIDTIKKTFPGIHWSTKVNKGAKEKVELIDLRQEIVRVTLNRHNLSTVLLDRIASKHPSVVNQCSELLGSIIHGT